MKVLIIGMGLSGKSAAHFLLAKGFEVFGVDRKVTQMEGVTIYHEGESVDISLFDLVVVSPGVSNTHPLYQAALSAQIEVIGEAELGLRYIKTPLFVVTGTNGKTTVTEMVTHILNAAGIKAKALGNIGDPITSDIQDSDNEVVVAELSSYQLETLQAQVVDAAVILNITPDHLDRHLTMGAYAKAKIRIKDCLKPDGKLFVYKKVYDEFGYLFEGFVPETYGYLSECDYVYEKNVVYNKKKIECLIPVSYRRDFSHDIENVMAAYVLCKEAKVAPEVFLKALSTFKKPPHRLEFVRQINGVNYFNDSKGTNIDAVIKAVQSMDGKVILIAGGVDKGSSYAPWIKAFADKVKCVCTIGEAACKIEEALNPQLEVKRFESLTAAVNEASKRAVPGDNVLLSPGCSSFDMFKDYLHRGEEFIRIVNNNITNKIRR